MTSTAPLQLHSCPLTQNIYGLLGKPLYVRMSVCVCLYLLMYARMPVCACARMPVCTYVYPYVRAYVLMYLCTTVRPYIRMSVCMFACFFIGLNGDDRCTFHTGDGIGGSEIKVGNEKGSSCIDICLERKKTDETINGVTVFTDTSKGGCWCERNMRGRNSVAKYMSGFIGDTGKSYHVVFITKCVAAMFYNIPVYPFAYFCDVYLSLHMM